MTEKFDQVKEATTAAMKEGFEKISSALTDAASLSKENLEAVVASSQIFSKGTNEAIAITNASTKAAYERGVAAAKSLSSAKSLQEVVELQSDYAKTALETFMSDFQKISELWLTTGKEASKPISERTNAVMSKIQAAQ